MPSQYFAPAKTGVEKQGSRFRHLGRVRVPRPIPTRLVVRNMKYIVSQHRVTTHTWAGWQGSVASRGVQAKKFQELEYLV